MNCSPLSPIEHMSFGGVVGLFGDSGCIQVIEVGRFKVWCRRC